MVNQTKPEGFHSITPYFTVNEANAFIDFLINAFDGKEQSRSLRPDGTIANAQVKIGDSIVEISDARPTFPPTTMAIHLYVADVDAVHKNAVNAGATSIREPTNQPYGDRDSFVKDPFGNSWYIATHL